jgi:F-type H+-transporting ATPase subunit epsilon
MQALFDFEIHTPYRLFFSGQAQAIILTLADGDICIYANHSPIAAPVIDCILRIKDADGNWRNAFVSGGVLEVDTYKNVLIVDAAEWSEEINRERALASKEEAEKILADSHFKFESNKARQQLRRAECRLKLLDLTQGVKND